MPAEPRLLAEEVRVRYGRTVAVGDVTLPVRPGETLALVGPNGSGKSSLVRVLAGLTRPQLGRCLLDGTEVTALPDLTRARRIAFVGQDEHPDLPFTAREVLLLGRSALRSHWSAYDDLDHAVVERCLTVLGLGRYGDRSLGQLSGGERQRVLIARALAQETETLVLDEPTNHLDPRYQHQVMELLAERDGTTVVVTHDLGLASTYCDRVALLHRGRLEACGPAAEVLTARRVAGVYGVRARTVRLRDRHHLVLGP